MLALEDYLDTLTWAESIGGLDALITRTNENFAALSRWVRTSEWATFTAAAERVRSTTSVCLKIMDRAFARLPAAEQFAAVRQFAALLESEGIAFDIASHRTAPPGLRIWCGATVDKQDVVALTPWLDWAWNKLNAA
jgi:phosphoserine aminotransferase